MGGQQTKPNLMKNDAVSTLYEERFTIERDLAKYDLSQCFENLVFEGGGTKGTAHVGALMVLEDLGILDNMTRFGGSSAGAMLAALLAIGYSADEILTFLYSDTKKIIMDSKCGYLSLLPSLFRHYGWIPGRRLEIWFKMVLASGPRNTLCPKTKDKGAITFMELYKATGIELCITATNVNYLTVDYFHPKTTPDTPIYKAVRMSMALPGFYRSVKVERSIYLGPDHIEKANDLFVDGGLICNYPIYVFDGWWLSLTPENQFLRRMRPLSQLHKFYDFKERFGTVNKKTLGIMLYSAGETEAVKEALDTRENSGPAQRPNTKLARVRTEAMIKKRRATEIYDQVLKLMDRFLQCLDAIQPMILDVQYDVKTVKDILSTKFSCDELSFMFPGHKGDLDKIIAELDENSDGKLSLPEVISFIEHHGIDLQKGFLGYGRRDIENLGDFIHSLQQTLSVNIKKMTVKPEDVERTIGINTDYIETTDWKMEFEDKRFLINCGVNGALSFLLEFIDKNKDHLPLKKDVYRSQRQQIVDETQQPNQVCTK
ncbi:Uncharacterized protein TrispH2_006474 [Trichoplax sp. H2]|nr:Uncharacterized protein TrispH2_006474 [Trichoplax sp. H2]|eukprot:RDD41320.1 Uncharacterized protein TrispH2_006474 [Trichoplax sp. H2]